MERKYFIGIIDIIKGAAVRMHPNLIIAGKSYRREEDGR
jgi:hypothetical protein